MTKTDESFTGNPDGTRKGKALFFGFDRSVTLGELLPDTPCILDATIRLRCGDYAEVTCTYIPELSPKKTRRS